MKRIALGVLSAGLMASASLLGGGCAGQGVAETPIAFAEVPAQSFVRDWAMDISDPKNSKRTVEWVHEAGSYLVVFMTDRNAYLIDKRNGTLTSVCPIRGLGPVMRPFTNGKKIGFPVSTQIEVFDVATGQVSRTVNLGVSVESTATFSPTTIYIGVAGLHGGRMLALDIGRKYDTPLWELLVYGAIQSAPIYDSGVLYFANTQGHVYAVDEKRNSVWPQLEKGYFEAGPVEADIELDAGSLYLASTDTKLTSLDRKTGKVRWEYYAQEPLAQRPIITDETAYVRTRGMGLVALDKDKGDFHRRPVWSNHEATKFLSEDSRYAYALLRNNAIGAMDRKTGAISFRSPPSDIDFFVTNTAKDGIIYGVTKKGYVIAIKPVIAPGTMGSPLFIQPTK